MAESKIADLKVGNSIFNITFDHRFSSITDFECLFPQIAYILVVFGLVSWGYWIF